MGRIQGEGDYTPARSCNTGPRELCAGQVLPLGKPQVQVQAVVGKRDRTAHGGHLLQAYVGPRCEIVSTQSLAHLTKEFDASGGIALIKSWLLRDWEPSLSTSEEADGLKSCPGAATVNAGRPGAPVIRV
jgi:hypothetical protein